MAAPVETIIVESKEHDGEKVQINADQFDKSIHTLVKEDVDTGDKSGDHKDKKGEPGNAGHKPGKVPVK